MSITNVQVVNTEIVTNRVGDSSRHYILYHMADGTHLLGCLVDVREIDEAEYQKWWVR